MIILNNEITKISIKKLIKALAVFDRFRTDMKNDRDQAGAIQAFEFCYELAWKSLKKVLEFQGILTATSPRECFRLGAREGIISNPELWFDFIKYRNIATHTYDESLVDEVLEIFPIFSESVKLLIKKLLENENVIS